MHWVKRSEESLDCNRALSTKIRRLDRELDAYESIEKRESGKLVTSVKEIREKDDFSILRRIKLQQKSKSAKSEPKKVEENQESLLVSL